MESNPYQSPREAGYEMPGVKAERARRWERFLIVVSGALAFAVFYAAVIGCGWLRDVLR